MIDMLEIESLIEQLKESNKNLKFYRMEIVRLEKDLEKALY